MEMSQSLCWYALHTRPRQEERAAQNLTAWGVETMVPKLKKAGASSGAKVIFPNYIFARFDERLMLHKVKFTRGVLYVVSFSGKLASISDHVIAAIQSRANPEGIVGDARRTMPGDPVLVKSGPFRDLMGVFEKNLRGRARVQILLTAVAYSARVEVAGADLKLLERPGDARCG